MTPEHRKSDFIRRAAVTSALLLLASSASPQEASPKPTNTYSPLYQKLLEAAPAAEQAPKPLPRDQNFQEPGISAEERRRRLNTYNLNRNLSNPLQANPEVEKELRTPGITSRERVQRVVRAVEAAREIKAAPSAAESERLHALFDLRWREQMDHYPEWATYAGEPGGNNRWTDMSFEAIEARKKGIEAPLEVLKSIRPESLPDGDRLHHELFLWNLERDLESRKYPDELIAIDQLDGPQVDAPQTLSIAPLRTAEDFENLVARVLALPAVIDQAIARMEKGLESGVTPPRVILRDLPEQIQKQIVDDPASAPLLMALDNLPGDLPQSEALRLRLEAGKAYREAARPAYEKLLAFVTDRYIPRARESVAFGDLPNGAEWYRDRVRRYTTTDLPPDEIHQIGLREVARIRAEMDEVIKETGFQGTFDEFTKFLREDPQFYFTNPQDLLMGYRDIAKRVDPALVKLFGKLPRLPYGIKDVPEAIAKSQPTAYYMGGSLEAGRPGYFYANTFDLSARPKWEMEALTLHEAVPGHHLQIALAQEMENVPKFRRHGGYTAYVEGWGLYAESLGGDLGLYQDPYSRFGRLTYEIWRAIRLVVDTGMHAKGWSRQQAIDYFIQNTGKSAHDIVVEVDRYIAWPGQALAYKLGEMKFKELREYARKELGAKFDIRRFHDEALSDGALPLEILDRKMREWVAKEKGAE